MLYEDTHVPSTIRRFALCDYCHRFAWRLDLPIDRMVIGRVETVTIGTEGITHGERFESWADISEFYGIAYFNGICLGYTANRRPHVAGSLPTTPLLSVNQFRELTEEMGRQISTRYPHVRIETVPREPDTGC